MMAEASLDEFFAKKDKSKKGKLRSKYTTTETIAKKLEEGGKRVESTPKKEMKEKISNSSINQTSSIPVAVNEVEDDEWDIEEKERDYSGLRIQALSMSEKEKEDEQLKEQMLSEQNGITSKHVDGPAGPWKLAQTTSMAEDEEEEEEEESAPETPPQEAAKSVGTYKPPALRNTSTSAPTSGSIKRFSKNAPQITSELHFPSLSSAVETKGKPSETDKTFQSVKHGVRSKGDCQKEVQLDLENKFSALHQGE